MQESAEKNIINFTWSIKEFFIVSLFLYITIIIFFIIGLSGCAAEPKTIVKYKYIEKPTPVLQTVPLSDLNLSKDKKLKLHIEVKEK